MCYSNCPYENLHGECRGFTKMITAKPHCYDDDDDAEEWEDYKESIEDSKIEWADYESTRQKGDNY